MSSDGRGRTIELVTLIRPMLGGTMLVGMDLPKEGEFGFHPSGIWDFTF